MRAYGTISALFNSLGQNVSNSFDFSQYASIKNGTYGKLLKSYYKQQSGDTSKTEASDSKVKKKTESLEDTTGLSQMKKESDGLKKSVDELAQEDLWKKTDGKMDMDKISSAVKSFVKDYNDVIDQSAKVSSKDIASSVKYMDSMTTTMTKSLSKIGITVGMDGKLSLDEDKLKKTDGMAAKNLFTGSVSYGSQIADRASEIAKKTVMNSSTYGSNGAASPSISGMFNQWI